MLELSSPASFSEPIDAAFPSLVVSTPDKA
jgi:hypothetical protein